MANLSVCHSRNINTIIQLINKILHSKCESHWPYQGVNYTFIGKIICEIINKNKIIKKQSEKHKTIVCSECLLRVIYVFCVVLCVGFCHGAIKLDTSTLFTTFFLWTYLQFIWYKGFLRNSNRLGLCTIAKTKQRSCLW